jgi:hypothetical protein
MSCLVLLFGRLIMLAQTRPAPAAPTRIDSDRIGSTRIDSDRLGLTRICPEFSSGGDARARLRTGTRVRGCRRARRREVEWATGGGREGAQEHRAREAAGGRCTVTTTPSRLGLPGRESCRACRSACQFKGWSNRWNGTLAAARVHSAQRASATSPPPPFGLILAIGLK